MKNGYFLLILVLALGSTLIACSKDSKKPADAANDKTSTSALKASGRAVAGSKAAAAVKFSQKAKSARIAAKTRQARDVKAGKAFYGRIILVNNDAIEMKYGRGEMKFGVDKNVKVTRLGEEAGIGDVEICQMARAFYKHAGGKKVLVKLAVSKESDCYR